MEKSCRLPTAQSAHQTPVRAGEQNYMSDVVLRQKVGIPAGIDERVVDAGGNGNADRHFFADSDGKVQIFQNRMI